MGLSAQQQELMAVFFAECQELLADMEQKLTDLEEGNTDSEVTNAIFRAIHSIKAGAGIFNFKKLVNFSHVFEAFLDQLRRGDITVSPEVIGLLYEGSDIVAALIDAAKKEEDLGPEYGQDILAKLEGFTQSGGGAADVSSAPPDSADEEPDGFGLFFDANETDGGIQPYTIKFAPKARIFQHANEPLLIIRELMTLGPVEVVLDYSHLPELGALEAENSYFRWTLYLQTDADLATIEEVFEFVVDDSDIEIESSPNRAADDRLAVNDAPGSGASSSEPIIPQQVLEALGQQASNGKEAKSSGQSIAGSANSGQAKAGSAKVTSIRVDLDRVDRLVNMVGELVITQAMLTQELENLGSEARGRLLGGMEELAAHARELQDNVMAVRMQPVKSVFSRMPRLVRDLSRKLDKQVKLNMIGETTEVDKTVIEEIADPLTHMIRNSLDHGLETPDEREAAGKDPQAIIWLRAEHRGGRIIIEVEDNGRGINRAKVLEKATANGLIEKDQVLSDEEIDNLIFHPGFSTADKVTDVSGRGVGMDVVRRNIMSLGGRISVSSVNGQGSKFTLALPLTLAVLDGMIVAVGGQKYVVPVNSITESIRPDAADVKTLVGGSQVVRVRGDYIPLVHLASVFGASSTLADPSKALMVIVETDSGSHIGLVVDELLGQQQVVIKSLEANYMHIEGISAATILGNGHVCLILDIDGLEVMEREMRVQGQPITDLQEGPVSDHKSSKQKELSESE